MNSSESISTLVPAYLSKTTVSPTATSASPPSGAIFLPTAIISACCGFSSFFAVSGRTIPPLVFSSPSFFSTYFTTTLLSKK